MKTILIKTMLGCFIILAFSASYAGQVIKGQRNLLLGSQSVQSTSTSQVQTQLTKVWNPGTKQWQNSDKLTYTYNSKGLLIYDLEQGWDTIRNVWFSNASDTFTYDASSRQTAHISTTLDSTGKILTYALKTTDSFSGNIATETNYGWIGSWYAQYRDIIYFNNGHDTLDINQGYTAGAWVNSQRTDSVLNSNSEVSVTYVSIWLSGKWYVTDKYRFYYDANGNDTLFVHMHGDSINNLSIAFDQETRYVYNSSNQVTQYIQNGSYNGANWFTMVKYNYSYNANGNDTQTIWQNWDSISKGWDDYIVYSYTYSTPTAISLIINPQIKVNLYPNPMQNISTIEIITENPINGRISIVNMNGNEITSSQLINLQPGKNAFKIQRGGLPPGIYFVIVSGESAPIINKLEVE